jgi:hypothetical protein
MTVRAGSDNRGAALDQAQPSQQTGGQRSGVESREIDVAEDGVLVDGAEPAIRGEEPVLEAIDTSGITRTSPSTPGKSLQADHLFAPDDAAAFRDRWDAIQRGFVDDPAAAVRDGDELVTCVIDALKQTFTEQRMDFESGADQPATEPLRLALRRYRSFFERLLAI